MQYLCHTYSLPVLNGLWPWFKLLNPCVFRHLCWLAVAVPSNAAFSKLSPWVLQFYNDAAHISAQNALVQYHVVGGNVDMATLSPQMAPLETVEGDTITVAYIPGSLVYPTMSGGSVAWRRMPVVFASRDDNNRLARCRHWRRLRHLCAVCWRASVRIQWHGAGGEHRTAGVGCVHRWRDPAQHPAVQYTHAPALSVDLQVSCAQIHCSGWSSGGTRPSQR